MKKRINIKTLLLTLLIFTGTFAICEAAPQPTVIRYALLTPGLGYAHTDLAIEKGIFKKHGIELKITYFLKGGAEAMAGVASGQIDAGTFGSPILTGLSRGIPIKVIGSPVTKDNPFVLVARNEYKKFEDLKGKTVAGGLIGNGTYQAFVKIAKAHKLTIDDFKNTNVSNSSQALLVLQSGQVAAAITTEPTATIVELEGAGHVIEKAVDYFGDYQHSYIFATDAIIKSNPQALRNLLAAELESRRYAKAHFEELVAFSVKKYELPEKVIRQYFTTIFKEWNFDGAVSKTGARNCLKILEELGDAEGVTKLKDEQIFNLSFLPAPTNTKK